MRHYGGQADGMHAVPRGQLLLGQVPEAALPGAQGGLPSVCCRFYWLLNADFAFSHEAQIPLPGRLYPCVAGLICHSPAHGTMAPPCRSLCRLRGDGVLHLPLCALPRRFGISVYDF